MQSNSVFGSRIVRTTCSCFLLTLIGVQWFLGAFCLLFVPATQPETSHLTDEHIVSEELITTSSVDDVIHQYGTPTRLVVVLHYEENASAHLRNSSRIPAQFGMSCPEFGSPFVIPPPFGQKHFGLYYTRLADPLHSVESDSTSIIDSYFHPFVDEYNPDIPAPPPELV